MASDHASTPETPILELTGLTVRYGPVLAVDQLNLTVPQHGAVALLGANGAGKTSTLSAISRLTDSSGTVRVDGADIAGRSAQAVARLGVAHVPEGRMLFPNLSVHENLQVARTATAKRDATYGPDEVYELFPALRKLRKRQAWSLSGGEQQMVAIGRGLCAAPKVLLLDEPTLGLAPVIVDHLYDALQRIRQDVSLIMVEQATDLALAICDDAYVLHGGRCVVHERSDQLQAGGDLMKAYLDGA